MSFQQKNITVTLINFSLILAYFSFRVGQMLLSDTFTQERIFSLWGVVIVWAVVASIIGIILTHVGSHILEAIRTRNEPDVEDIQDERDKIIDLRGDHLSHVVNGLGVFVSMLTFVYGQPPLVMFTLLIFFTVLSQIAADIYRLALYRKAF